MTPARSGSSGWTRRPTVTGCTSGSACSSRRPSCRTSSKSARRWSCTRRSTPIPADWRELLDRWGLAGKAGTSFGKLSGGQKQRLFIALALVGNPEVVFLDELTAGLDPGARRATWDLIAQVRGSGVTVVLVSHFMDEVEELCDRVAILERGRIAALDTPAGLVDSAGGRVPDAVPADGAAGRAVADHRCPA